MGYSDGRWIYYHTGEKKRPDSRQGNPSPYFRKCFSLKDDIERAVMYVSCLGVFKAYINGTEVSSGYIAACRCDYEKRLPVIKYDVTELLKPDNAVGIVCGEGWAVGSVPFGNSFRRGCFSDEIYLYAVIDIVYKNGEADTIITDKTWKGGVGAVRYSSVYGGECIDKRESCVGFSKTDFDDSSWKSVSEDAFSRNYLLTEYEGPGIAISGSLKPAKAADRVYDFGRYLSGGLRLRVSGKKGDKVKVLYSDDSAFSIATEDLLILGGNGEEEFVPMFSVHRFRYVKIETESRVIDAEALEIGSEVARTGDFYCSDNRINENFINAVRLQKRRLLGIPENNFYGEMNPDAALFDMYSFGVNEFYKKYFSDIRDAQISNGFIPEFIPMPQFGYRKLAGKCCAAEAVKLVHQHFVMYGDIGVVKENLLMCKRAAGCLNQESLICLAECYSYMINLCSAVSDAEASVYKKLYNEVKAKFAETLVDGHTLSDTQGDYISAYETGILTANEIRRPLLNTVKRDDEPHPHLLQVLCDIGEKGTAYSLICEKPDLFNKIGDLSWFYSGVLGIKPVETPDGAGFKKVVIEPAIDLSDRVRKAGGSCITPYGKISVYWEKTDDFFTCCLTVPFDIDATCRFSGFKVINQKCSRETYVFMLKKVINHYEV